jgi:hypothetical protein
VFVQNGFLEDFLDEPSEFKNQPPTQALIFFAVSKKVGFTTRL